MRVFIFGAALAALAAPAIGAPALSGHYALNVSVLCQSTTTFPGMVVTKLADANYDPVAGTVTVNGIQTSGKLTGAGGAGMNVTAISYTSPYSNSDTTLTAAGVTWSIQYGAVDGAGVAQSYLTNGLVNVGAAPLCNGWATALHK